MRSALITTLVNTVIVQGFRSFKNLSTGALVCWMRDGKTQFNAASYISSLVIRSGFLMAFCGKYSTHVEMCRKQSAEGSALSLVSVTVSW